MAKKRIYKPRLNPRQALFVKYYLETASMSVAYEQAGYKSRHPSASAHALMELPQVKEAIESAQAELRERAVYNGQKAMEQAQQAVEFAISHRNAMAFVKAVELKAKIAGLLIEKHDINVNVVSISSALENASRRVMPLLLEQPITPEIVIEAKKVEPSDSAEGS